MSGSAQSNPTPDPSGGLGGGSRDTHLIEKAIRQRWPIPEHLRQLLPEALGEIAIDPDKSDRNRIAAVRALTAMDALNLAQEERDEGGQHVNHHVDGTLTVDARRSRLATVLAAVAERGSANGTGASPSLNGSGKHPPAPEVPPGPAPLPG